MHGVAGHAALRQRTQCRQHCCAGRIRIIITDPGLEQVAENVERLRTAGRAGQKLLKLPDRARPGAVQMQVGDKQCAQTQLRRCGEARRSRLISAADSRNITRMCADIVTRFAPSPTGELHLGNARTALFNWLLAHHGAGRMILRIEDTDAGRSDAAKTEALQADLEWLGLRWEEGPQVGGPAGPYLQSARQRIYDRYFAVLEGA